MGERMTLVKTWQGCSNAITEAVHEILVDKGITEPCLGGRWNSMSITRR